MSLLQQVADSSVQWDRSARNSQQVVYIFLQLYNIVLLNLQVIKHLVSLINQYICTVPVWSASLNTSIQLFN